MPTPRVTKAAFEAPVVAKVVSPTGLSRQLEGATVTLCLTVDADGHPSDIKVMSQGRRALTGNLVAVVSQVAFHAGEEERRARDVEGRAPDRTRGVELVSESFCGRPVRARTGLPCCSGAL